MGDAVFDPGVDAAVGIDGDLGTDVVAVGGDAAVRFPVGAVAEADLALGNDEHAAVRQELDVGRR